MSSEGLLRRQRHGDTKFEGQFDGRNIFHSYVYNAYCPMALIVGRVEFSKLLFGCGRHILCDGVRKDCVDRRGRVGRVFSRYNSTKSNSKLVMRNLIMMWGALCVSFVFLTTACNLLDGGRPSMKTVMQEGFKGDDSLLKKIIEERAAKHEKELFVTYVETLPGFAPKKGTGWSKKATAVVRAAKAIRDGSEDLDALKKATNCRSCHEPHKVYPPGKNPYAPKDKKGK